MDLKVENGVYEESYWIIWTDMSCNGTLIFMIIMIKWYEEEGGNTDFIIQSDEMMKLIDMSVSKQCVNTRKASNQQLKTP